MKFFKKLSVAKMFFLPTIKHPSLLWNRLPTYISYFSPLVLNLNIYWLI